MTISGVPRLKTGRWRRSRALRVVSFGVGMGCSISELLGMVMGRGDGGGRGSGKRRRRLRSGITGEDEGESQGENGVSEGSGQCRGVASRRRHAVQARQAARELRGELGVRGRAPLCLPGERKQVAGTGQHSAGPASGLPGGLRQVSGQVVSSLSLFSILITVFYFCSLF